MNRAVPVQSPARPSQLFVRLWNTVAKREDSTVRENFFSECIGGALNADLGLAREFTRILNKGRDRIGGTSISRAEIKVTPQFSCTSRNRQCYVDLRLDVGKAVIGVEVKLDAPEGSAPGGERQLSKYLAIKPLTHIAFITGYNTTVDANVARRKGRYLAPARRDHFLWSDFYQIVHAAAGRRTAPQLNQALLELFHARHLEPAHPDLPDLSTPEGRDKFRSLWTGTRKRLSQFYEVVAPPRINATMYAWNHDYKDAWKIGLEPAVNPGLLRVWLYMQNRRVRDESLQLLRRMFENHHGAFRGASAEARIGAGIAKAGISVWLPYRSIFSRRSSVASKEKRLADVIEQMIEVVNNRRT